jgi:hypothetical protein
MFETELTKIDTVMASAKPGDIPPLFANIPLDWFGKLLLNVPSKYPNIKAFFPVMASDKIQDSWTGRHGEDLLNQSLSFVKTLIYGYAAITGKKLGDATILDYGCGWGRLIRLLYKFVPIENIYGVDPWDESIKICKKDHVKGNFAISDYVPETLPFKQKFDLIFAFSVFTHLSEKTMTTVLNTLRNYIADDGVLVITIRPQEYWLYHGNGKLADPMLKAHQEKGFAFTPHNRPPINGDITYGDASVSLAYLEQHFPKWKLESVECNDSDAYQIILFLRPA